MNTYKITFLENPVTNEEQMTVIKIDDTESIDTQTIHHSENENTLELVTTALSPKEAVYKFYESFGNMRLSCAEGVSLETRLNRMPETLNTKKVYEALRSFMNDIEVNATMGRSAQSVLIMDYFEDLIFKNKLT